VKESELFFTQVKTLYAKEGKICIYDSALARAPPTPVRLCPLARLSRFALLS
jgi:hypothetical protein